MHGESTYETNTVKGKITANRKTERLPLTGVLRAYVSKNMISTIS